MKVYTITKEWEGSRLDRFVRAIFPGTPFGVIQILLRKGRIFLNDKKADGSARLKAGDVVAIQIEEIEEGDAPKPKRRSSRRAGTGGETRTKAPVRAPKRFHLDPKILPPSLFGIGRDIRILYEDDYLLIIDKPVGLVVQPGNRKERGSLLDLLEEYRLRAPEPARSGRERPVQPPDGGAEETLPFRYAPVHRLDKETSGALVIAKTRKAARSLSMLLAHHLATKEYLAVVEGVPSARTGEISTPLATEKGDRSHSVPSAGGKQARTKYEVLQKLPGGRCLVKVMIDTGRTHQIRAHLASIGHPVAGDREYGATGAAPRRRLLLHAWTIQFPHPETADIIVATAPPPDDFELGGE